MDNMETETKERPIIFSGEMVRAILDGRKTQTRRVVKPPKGYSQMNQMQGGMIQWAKPGYLLWTVCPYGQPGDRLWVRETWGIATGPTSYDNQPMTADNTAIVHRATWDKQFPDIPLTGAWKPSIHMPRWASRINLEIVSVRVERLKDISEADAEAEGVVSTAVVDPDGKDYRGLYAFEHYAELWDRINGAGSWAANPWVWVVEFKKI